jgi:hypothetical protein
MLGGTTYYTTAGADPLTTSSTSLDYVTVPFSGCRYSYPLPAPLTINDGDSIDVSAFFSLDNIAWGTLTGAALPSGCVLNGGHTDSACLAYPDIVPYVGTTSATLETYLVTEDQTDLLAAKAGGQVLLVADAVGTLLGGFTRRFYSATSVSASTNYDTPLQKIVDDGLVDGGLHAYLLQNFGGTPPGPTFYVKFPAFERTTHNGTYVRGTDFSTINYRAVKQ